MTRTTRSVYTLTLTLVAGLTGLPSRVDAAGRDVPREQVAYRRIPYRGEANATRPLEELAFDLDQDAVVVEEEAGESAGSAPFVCDRWGCDSDRGSPRSMPSSEGGFRLADPPKPLRIQRLAPSRVVPDDEVDEVTP